MPSAPVAGRVARFATCERVFVEFDFAARPSGWWTGQSWLPAYSDTLRGRQPEIWDVLRVVLLVEILTADRTSPDLAIRDKDATTLTGQHAAPSLVVVLLRQCVSSERSGWLVDRSGGVFPSDQDERVVDGGRASQLVPVMLPPSCKLVSFVTNRFRKEPFH